MKKKNNLFEKIYHKQNILTAHKNARKGKLHYRDVKFVDSNLTSCIDEIHNTLKNKTFRTSDYKIASRIERGKIRKLYKLPYFKDRIIHHAILQVIEPIIMPLFIKDTYQAIKGRGVHQAKNRMHAFLKDKKNTKYCLKVDIKKYYPSVNTEILKKLIRKKIQCRDTLWILDDIIDSTQGIPIGNYTSQLFGNFYLAYFDHFVKEELGVKYYIRYADDMVFFSDDKSYLHTIKKEIEAYLQDELALTLKENWQVFPTRTRGVDFLGFRFFGTHTLLRKSIAKNAKSSIKQMKKKPSKKSLNAVMSYYGWLKHSDSYNFIRKFFTKELRQKGEDISKKYGFKNPLNKIYTLPKPPKNRFGKVQKTLF